MEKTDYFKKLIEFDLDLLKEMEDSNQGRVDIQPSVEPVIGRFLSFLVRLTKAKKVLELGTSVGFSSIWIANALKQQDGILHTVDSHDLTALEAKSNFEKAGLDNIVQHIDDIAEVLPKLDAGFDIIFQDGAKALYPTTIDRLYDLLNTDGVLVADDVLFPCLDNVRENLKNRVDDFNKKIMEDKRFYTVYLPLGHGISLSYKK